ncbi:MAG TPA: hypothetical protein VNQ73_01820 [Ilumatobacter sp.]|nr:hypothetical protein [Ilumatobacter sp.]
MTAFDTSPDAAVVRLAVLRRLTPRQRAELTIEMSEQSFAVARAGIRQRHPEYTDDDVRFAMLRLLHGDAVVRTIYPDEPLRAT